MLIGRKSSSILLREFLCRGRIVDNLHAFGNIDLVRAALNTLVIAGKIVCCCSWMIAPRNATIHNPHERIASSSDGGESGTAPGPVIDSTKHFVEHLDQTTASLLTLDLNCCRSQRLRNRNSIVLSFFLEMLPSFPL